MELAAVINGRIRRMSRGVNPSLVSWLTTMMGLRLQVVLEHMPVGPDAILRYVRRVGDPLSHCLRSPWKFKEQKERPQSLSGRMPPCSWNYSRRGHVPRSAPCP